MSDMEVTIFVNHLGIVFSHGFQVGEQGFFDLGGVMLPVQCFLNFTKPIAIGDGILW